MRIISGKYRGRNLLSPKGDEVRPTSDLVRESIFDTIQTGVVGCSFLDLFAGSGGVGIEALSRGADRVVFSDQAKSSLQVVSENLKKIDANYKLLLSSYRDTLTRLKEQFDYIFIDPPYATDYFEDIANIVYEKKLLNDSGYLIYEHNKKKEYKIPTEYVLKKSKKYGNIIVDYIAKTELLEEKKFIATERSGNYFITEHEIPFEKRGEKCIISGSFDPITLGHIDLIDKAQEYFSQVIAVVAINIEKKYTFDLQERTEIARRALKTRENCYAVACEGMLYEKCQELGVNTIVRGYRNQDDLSYENYMAKFNKEHGNIDTILFKAKEKFSHLSSTKVRHALAAGNDLSEMLPSEVIEIVKKYYMEKKI